MFLVPDGASDSSQTLNNRRENRRYSGGQEAEPSPDGSQNENIRSPYAQATR